MPYCYYPDPVGGTEIYVAGLAKWQRFHGWQVAIAAPGNSRERYDHADTTVWRFPVSPAQDLSELYGEGDPVAAEGFGAILDEYHPDVVHLHALTSAVSIRLVGQAAKRGIPVVFNYHTPTVSCSRGTLLRWGSEICDGTLDRRACAACTLHTHGLARPVAAVLASFPPAIGRQLGHAGLSGGLWTAMRMSELIEVRVGAFHRLMESVDHVIALCDWGRELLIRNGVTQSKITLSRQGICHDVPGGAVEPAAPRPFRLPLRAAFLGRFDATKGVHLIVQALRDNPDLPIQLDLFGVPQGASGERYAAEIDAAIAGDGRMRILPPLASDRVIPRLRDYDFVVVPSQWLETGPLVVLEAFAAGTPVLGSKLGGIAELVTHGVDGLLVEPPGSATAWAETLRSVCTSPRSIGSLRAGIRPPRHIKQTALDMLSVYHTLPRTQCSDHCLLAER